MFRQFDHYYQYLKENIQPLQTENPRQYLFLLHQLRVYMEITLQEYEDMSQECFEKSETWVPYTSLYEEWSKLYKSVPELHKRAERRYADLRLIRRYSNLYYPKTKTRLTSKKEMQRNYLSFLLILAQFITIFTNVDYYSNINFQEMVKILSSPQGAMIMDFLSEEILAPAIQNPFRKDHSLPNTLMIFSLMITPWMLEGLFGKVEAPDTEAYKEYIYLTDDEIEVCLDKFNHFFYNMVQYVDPNQDKEIPDYVKQSQKLPEEPEKENESAYYSSFFWED